MRTEDPARQVGYLQQCLSSDKKPLGFFLGAGCPLGVRVGEKGLDPIIPDIAGITRIVREDLGKTTDCGPLLQVLDGHFEVDGRQNTNVEDILTHIRALRVVAGTEEVRGLKAQDLDLLDDKICELIQSVTDKSLPTDRTPYHSLAAWVDAVRRESPVEIFTTNYDLLMEQALEEFRVPYFDGFGGSRRPFFDLRAMEEDMLPARWARLWKLHGSVNWYEVPKRGVFRGGEVVEKNAKRVIHPSHLKYQESRRMPYLAMIDRLRAFLKTPTATLILCGYSFRDEHINEVIVQGLEASPTTIAFALLFGPLEDYSQATALALSRSNLSLLAMDGGVVSGRFAKWPVKNKDSVSSPSTKWVTWVPLDQEEIEAEQTAEFHLGDFSVFGGFLEEVVGTGIDRGEESDAE